ncbi:MAG: DUF1684 domain-containing protein [Actinobacteria bacterium]|jgi:uncharacterized protein (DUF1684 family)|nr:DUF1684 domain-containing protein [Actinomycetota bacterium]
MTLTLLDWRRRVQALYREVRAAPDPADGHACWRAVRDELFATHSDSPLLPGARQDFSGLPVAAYDPAWRFEVEVEPFVEPGHLEVPTGTDGTVVFDRIGRAVLPGVGGLDVWWLGSYGGGVFVPLKDASAGRRTYGGGRYLLDTVKGADLGGGFGRLVLDLNFAYNPSCAYDPAWACPLAPPGNVLDVEVPVGEAAPA